MVTRQKKCSAHDPQCGPCINNWWNMNASVEDGWCYMFRVRQFKCRKYAPIVRSKRASVATAKLCQIYFEIASEAIGEDEVRRKRDERIQRVMA